MKTMKKFKVFGIMLGIVASFVTIWVNLNPDPYSESVSLPEDSLSSIDEDWADSEPELTIIAGGKREIRKSDSKYKKVNFGDNSTLILSSDWNLRAQSLQIGNNVHIIGKGVDGVAGEHGGPGKDAKADCTDGSNGKDGKAGKNGGNGLNIFIQADKAEIGSLMAKIPGGSGGNGGAGGDGGKGGKADRSDSCPGGRGGDGGNGGKAGNGGDGGRLRLSGSWKCLDKTRDCITVYAERGEAGQPGSGGKGGAGGPGRGAWLLGGGQPSGSRGNDGEYGAEGESGETGSYSEHQTSGS